MRYRLSFRDERQDRGGPVMGGRLERLANGEPPLYGDAACGALVAEPRVTFLLHGFNVSLSDGTGSLIHFANLLHGVDGGLVATVWPGDSVLGGISYSFEGTAADDTAIELERFVSDHLVPGPPVSFASHSLGARVVLSAMRRLSRRGIAVEQVCLLAPAVDDDSLAQAGVYRGGVEDATRVAVVHSTKDRVLELLYPAGDWLQAFAFFWRDQPGLALGYHGPRAAGPLPVPANVIQEAVGQYGVDHGDYLPPPDLHANVPLCVHSAALYTEQVLTGMDHPAYPRPRRSRSSNPLQS